MICMHFCHTKCNAAMGLLPSGWRLMERLLAHTPQDQANGARLGWLAQTEERTVEIWGASRL